jgi:1,4-alpha-glucan branching enzyme
LHELDFSQEGFIWIDCHDADQSILSYLRRARDDATWAVVLNFTPVPRYGYRIGVPQAGQYKEIFNSDSAYYGGSNVGNRGGLTGEAQSWMGYPYSSFSSLQ